MGSEYNIVDADYQDEHGTGIVIEREVQIFEPDPPTETLEELLAVELEWEAKVSDDDQQWVEDGIELYRKLIYLQPNEARYKHALASLYLQSGTHEKTIRLNRHKAEALFLESLSLNPDHPLTNYHLGFIYWYEQEWTKSIEYFTRSLEKRQQLTKRQIIRALSSICIGYAYLGESLQSQAFFDQVWREDTDRAYIPELELTRFHMLERQKESQPGCIVQQNGTIRRISFKDIDEITMQAVEGGAYVLDCVTSRSLFSGPSDAVNLQPRLARLLEFLMKQTKPRTAGEIAEDLFNGFGAERVRVYIQQLRRSIAPCVDISPEKLIVTEPQGYLWKPGTSSLLILNEAETGLRELRLRSRL